MMEVEFVTRRVYLGAPLFGLSELTFNVMLGRQIDNTSNGRYALILPQSLAWPTSDPDTIREINLSTLAKVDAAIFNLDGTDADSGTVVEFMWAVSNKKPCVLFRTDFRSGDLDGAPCNLMLTGWPRTRFITAKSFFEFRERALHSGESKSIGDQSNIVQDLVNELSAKLIAALDGVIGTE
jgi:nucleoside 2-deoxyribosyltransferase